MQRQANCERFLVETVRSLYDDTSIIFLPKNYCFSLYLRSTGFSTKSTINGL